MGVLTTVSILNNHNSAGYLHALLQQGDRISMGRYINGMHHHKLFQ